MTAAASVARESHGGGAGTVVMAGVEALSDGVVATGLAGALDAPILLNAPDALSPQVLDVLRELDTQRVVVIGGSQAVGDAVLSSMTDLGIEVERIAGPSRYDTAGMVADAVAEASAGVGRVLGRRTALVVPAEDVPASLEAGSLAATQASPLPVLVSQDGDLNDPTRQAIRRLGIQQLLVVAGGAAPTPRITGFDGEIRLVEGPTGAADEAVAIRDFRPPRVVVVPPGDEARALIAGPLAGREAGVILTAEHAEAWLTAACETVAELFVVGEPAVITDGDVERLVRALDCADA